MFSNLIVYIASCFCTQDVEMVTMAVLAQRHVENVQLVTYVMTSLAIVLVTVRLGGNNQCVISVSIDQYSWYFHNSVLNSLFHILRCVYVTWNSDIVILTLCSSTLNRTCLGQFNT